jgi:hypothetical protein
MPSRWKLSLESASSGLQLDKYRCGCSFLDARVNASFGVHASDRESIPSVRIGFILVLLTVPLRAHAAVLGFDESFNATGPYPTVDGMFDGLDNPNWQIEGDGTFANGGYVVINEDEDPSGESGGAQDRIFREVSGRGSFLSSVTINDAYLGDLTLEGTPLIAQGNIALRHRLASGLDNVLRISLYEPDVPAEGEWHLVVAAGVLAESMLVPEGQDIALSILYDDIASEVAFIYDPDTSDESVGISMGPFSYTGLFLESTEAELRFGALGRNARADGIVDHWSMAALPGIPGDFNGNGILDAADIDQLSEQVRTNTNNPLYDLNADALVNDLDRQVWVHDLKQTWFGDADLNGAFDSTDLVQALASGQYEDDVELNSAWLTGDWDGDRDFTCGDLVVALADGGYEAGAAAVPEPTGIMLAMGAAAIAASHRRSKTRGK